MADLSALLAASGDALGAANQIVELLPQAAVKLAAAAFCGVLFGYERERRGKPAGMKTNALICIGAATYMFAADAILAAHGQPGDPARMAGQIVTGIGFLGAGSIMRAGESVTGLTSAATIWFMGAVGVLIGCGFPIVAIGLTLVALGLVVLLRRLEFRFFSSQFCVDCTITIGASDPASLEAVRRVLGERLTRREALEETRRDDVVILRARGCGPHMFQGDVLRSLWSIPGVREVHQNR